MRINGVIKAISRRLARRPSRSFKADDAGATAVEFAIVATPFLMFIFGLIGCALYFFTTSSIENGMDRVTRLIRTGEAVSSKMTVTQFKQDICNSAGTWIDCKKLQIFVESYPNGWASLNGANPQPCVQDGAIVMNPAPGSDLIAIYSGTASDVVVVTACYKWDFTAKLPFLKLGNMADGSMMMQTATSFRSEPYPGS
jgi:Flp pilus assembly protein TadG